MNFEVNVNRMILRDRPTDGRTEKRNHRQTHICRAHKQHSREISKALTYSSHSLTCKFYHAVPDILPLRHATNQLVSSDFPPAVACRLRTVEQKTKLALGSHFYADYVQLYLTCRRIDISKRAIRLNGPNSSYEESIKDGRLMVLDNLSASRVAAHSSGCHRPTCKAQNGYL